MFVKFEKPDASSQDYKNREIMDRLVGDYFSLEGNSQSYFSKRLWTPKIDGELVNMFGLDSSLRAAREVDDTVLLENKDEGWRLFRDRFPVFVMKFGVNYKIFREGKVSVNKNSVKLRKALVGFYTDQENIDRINSDIFHSGIRNPYVKEITDFYKDEIIYRIDRWLNEIGSFSITKTGKIRVVVSANFADWFLCSTGNSWGSCLSLNSDYEYGYWTGLPGLIGDKNRVMVYITDDEEKDFYGIKTHKVINRSWGILTKDGKIALLNWYPNRFFDASSLNEIFGVDVFLGEESGYDEWVSKHKVHLLFNDDGQSRFIYQDYSQFSDDKYIITGESGHCYFDSFGEGRVRYGDIYDIPASFVDVVESKSNVASYDGAAYCDHCGERMHEDDSYNVDGERICNYCFEENYFTCESCSSIHHIDNAFTNESTGELYCESCSDDLLVESEHDGLLYEVNDCYTVVDERGTEMGWIRRREVDNGYSDYIAIDDKRCTESENCVELEEGSLMLNIDALNSNVAVECKYTKEVVPKKDATFLGDEGAWVSTEYLESYRDSLQFKMKVGVA